MRATCIVIALALEVAQIGQPGAHHALVVDAAMFIEAGVLACQDRIGHHLGNVLEAGQVAPLLAELAQQETIAGVHPQGQDGPVVGQFRDVGQIRECHCQRDGDHHGQRQCTGHQQAQGSIDHAQPQRGPRGLAAAGGIRRVPGAGRGLISGHRTLVRARHHYKNGVRAKYSSRCWTAVMVAVWPPVVFLLAF